MRTAKQERARYQWLTPRQFGERVGMGEDKVRELIRAGWFGVQDGTPECIDTRLPGRPSPEYRVHPDAVGRFFRERAVTEAA